MNNLDLPGPDLRLRSFAAALSDLVGADHDYINVAMAGRRMVLQGSVPSYSLKRRIEDAARSAGFGEIENGLRVAPGIPLAGGLL